MDRPQKKHREHTMQSISRNTRRPSYRECSKEYKAAIEEIYG